MSNNNGSEKNRHRAFICSKGNLDMAYPALIMGWAALGNGIDVSLFFTFWGMDIINKNRIDHLEIPPVANTSMKMSMMGVPGNLGIPNMMGVFPGMTAFATNLMHKKIAGVGVGSSLHGDNNTGSADFGAVNVLGTGASEADAAYDNGTGTCSNINCHNNKTTLSPYRWYDAGTTSCTMCHTPGGSAGNVADPTTGLHKVTNNPANVRAHDNTLTDNVSSNKGCRECHVVPAMDNTAGSTHINAVFPADNSANGTTRYITRTNMTWVDNSSNNGTCFGTGLTGCHSDGGAWKRMFGTQARVAKSPVSFPGKDVFTIRGWVHL